LLASDNNSAASAVDTDNAAADVSSAVGFPWAAAVVMVSAVAGVPAAAVVLTAVFLPGAPAVAKVFVVAVVTTAVDVHPATVFPTFTASLLLLVSLLLMASLFVKHPLLKNVVSTVFGLLAIGVPWCSSCHLNCCPPPSVYIVLSAVNLPEFSAVVFLPTVVNNPSSIDVSNGFGLPAVVCLQKIGFNTRSQVTTL
jgi:hypothetical protein